MSSVRVLVGTRKGAFILTADGTRRTWQVNGPHFAGWEVYHVKGSPVAPNRLYLSQGNSWFGQIVQRSDDGGATWETVDEVMIALSGPATQRSLIDALEARCPMLLGTIRDHHTKLRRPYLRFYANEEDLSNQSPDAPLPEAVVSGREPFLVIGAMSGGEFSGS
jgi:hypothetical protein